MKTKLIGEFNIYINDGNYGEIYPDKEQFKANGIPFISASDFTGRVFNFNGIKHIDDKLHFEVLTKGHLQKNDILIVVRGNGIGKVGYFKEDIGECNINAQLAFIRTDKSELNPLYLYYLLSSKTYFNLFKKFGSGSAQPQLPINRLKLVPIVYHDITVQQKIATVLSNLDTKIELNNRINRELEQMAKLLYDYWFVQFEFPFTAENFSPESGEMSAGQRGYKSSGGRMVYNKELKREIPAGWEVGNLLNLGEIIGGSTPPREVIEYFTNNGTAWITPKDLSLNFGNKFITKGELDVSDSGIKVASLNVMPKGTILLSSRAPIGYLAISREKVTTNQGFKSFVPNKGFSTEFVYYSVKNMIPAIENNAVGSTFKEVSATTLKSIPVCLPNKTIINKYTKLANKIFAKQDLLELENHHLTSLRDWLLPMLMNGQVRVGEASKKEYPVNETEMDLAAEPGK